MGNDLRYAFRTLVRAPLFTAVAVLSLALGIGANTAIFSLLRQVMLRYLPVASPEQLVVFHFEGARNGSVQSDNNESVFSYTMYREFRDRNQVFNGVCARAFAVAHVLAGGEAEEVHAEAVSGNFFDVLGVSALRGRLFTPADDVTPMGHPLAVISHAYWTRRFGANAAILNQPIRVNGQPFTIIGVTPQSFKSVTSGESPDLWVTLAMRAVVNIDPGVDDLRTEHSYWLTIFGRLKPGMPQTRAAAAIDTQYRALLEEDMTRSNASQRFRQRATANHVTLRLAAQGINQIRGRWEKPLVAVMAMVALVLLIACANVSNLLIARASGRRREIAIRMAIGAGRWTLIRQLLTESLLLACAGGMAGLICAYWIAEGLIGLLPNDSLHGWLSAGVDLPVLGFAFGVSLLAGLLFGLAPALSASRPDLVPALRDHGHTVMRAQAALRRTLVVAQIALSLVLLIAAGLFARSLMNLIHHDLGFQPERLLTFHTDPSRAGYQAEREQALVERLRERLAALPGVTNAAAAAALPFENSDSSANVTVEGYRAGDDESTDCEFNLVSPGYFRTLGVPLKAGREFTPADDAKGKKVAVINEAFANQFFRGRNPLGQRMAQGSGDVKLDIEIVGIARNSNYSSVKETTARFYYFPYLQRKKLAGISFMVRSGRDNAALAADVRRIVHETDASIPVSDLQWMEAQVERSISVERLTAWLASGFGVLAMLLAVVGLYGVIAYLAARRTAEIGLRIALGATRGRIVGLVLREVAWLLAAGLAIGIPCAIAAGRYIESQLFGVHAGDPVTLIAAAAVLALAALAAGYLPARRAASIDPLEALRYE